MSLEWLKIPGAVKAVSKLVGDTAEVGCAGLDIAKAKFEQVAQGIRDETGARTKMLSTAVNRTSESELLNDVGFQQRMLNRFIQDETKKQINRDAVAQVAIEDLKNSPPNENTSGPSDDWMNVFSSYAEKASSDALREHWGKILAGEIRSQESFSLRTLQLMAVLDQKMAKVIEDVRGFIINEDIIFLIGEIGSESFFDAILALENLGFLRSGVYFNKNFDDEGLINLKANSFLLRLHGEKQTEFSVSIAAVTPSGKELLKIIPPCEDFNIIKKVAEDLKNYRKGLIKKVEIARIIQQKSENRVSIDNFIEV